MGDELLGVGQGLSRRVAETAAAAQAIERLRAALLEGSSLEGAS